MTFVIKKAEQNHPFFKKLSIKVMLYLGLGSCLQSLWKDHPKHSTADLYLEEVKILQSWMAHIYHDTTEISQIKRTLITTTDSRKVRCFHFIGKMFIYQQTFVIYLLHAVMLLREIQWWTRKHAWPQETHRLLREMGN